MEIGTAEISRIIKEQIRDYEKSVEIQDAAVQHDVVARAADGIIVGTRDRQPPAPVLDQATRS